MTVEWNQLNAEGDEYHNLAMSSRIHIIVLIDWL